MIILVLSESVLNAIMKQQKITNVLLGMSTSITTHCFLKTLHNIIMMFLEQLMAVVLTVLLLARTAVIFNMWG